MSPRERYKQYVSYLRMKVQERDWHAVADAAMDIRELLATHPYLEGGKKHGTTVE